jgi:amidase
MTLIMHQRAVAVCLFAAGTLAYAADLAGTWSFRLVRFGEETGATRAVLQLNGNNVTGKISDDVTLEGTVKDGAVSLRGTRNGKAWGVLEGRITGDEMSGNAKIDGDEVAWRARRLPAPEPPQTREFEPTVFHRYFSSTIAPALEINPGDTVRTWTVDAGGVDAKGVRRSGGGNPETGPFYVRGAMPGDTLVVKLNRIRPNRDTAESGTMIIPGALDAGYLLSHIDKSKERVSGEWKLDREAGYAAPATPSERLKNFKVKMRPMLGCVAVAPPQKESYRTGWLGNYGGNMDYNGLVEGTTLYLPVYQEGALLFVGDGHAAQGDGELTGDALETSMDVEFTVNLVTGQNTRNPRAENDEFIMAMGIGNSLGEALQTATTQLALWLERDYHLTPYESALVLGSSIRYDIAEIVDPRVHIVAKLSKSVVAMLK